MGFVKRLKNAMAGYKKGQSAFGMGALVPMVLMICVAGLIAAYSLLTLSNVQTSGFSNTSSPGYLAIANATSGIGAITAGLPNIGQIAVAVVIILLLVGGFGMVTQHWGGGRE